MNRFVSLAMLLAMLAVSPRSQAAMQDVQTVFIILMENHDWSSIHGSASAPYINNTLLPMASRAEQYKNPPGLHPSEPNYIWLEAGSNLGITTDADPTSGHSLSTTAHLVTQLKNAGVTWTSYQEDITGSTCPITSSGLYAAKHNPMIFFNDVSGAPPSTSSAECIANVRPYTELATDLANHTVTRYNFLTPNLCNDMHNSSGCATTDSIKNGDNWLAANIPTILNSQAYSNNGAIFITWDEGTGTSDGPIGMIVISPLAKGGGYSNTIPYTHSSTLRSFQEIFNVGPLLNDAANATDLSDLFKSVSLVASGATLTAESCTATNGVVDPGETVTANINLANTGSGNTSNLVVTLQATGGVASPSGAQTYGIITNGTAKSRPFTFTANGTCGGTVTATFQLQDVTTNYGTVAIAFPLGQNLAPLTQNFDGVTAPALPAGWATSASGTQSNWVTSTSVADSSPNAAFSQDPVGVGTNELVTPSFSVASSAAQLTFRQSYNLTASTTNTGIGYDGGVLEISVGAGPYADILGAGGSFASGGYNRTLSGTYGNPLAGRSAWSGNSGGYTTTVVNLPSSAAGQSVQLRWRCGTGTAPTLPAVAPLAAAVVLAGWDTSALTTYGPSPFAPTTSNANVTVVGLTRGGGVNTTGTAAARGWGANGWDQSNSANAISTADYATFSVAAKAGYKVSFDSISKFDYRHSGTGATSGLLQYQVGSGDTFHDITTVSYSSATSGGGSIAVPIDLSGTPALQNVASGTTVTFRLVNYGGTGGTWYIYDVGNTTASDFEIKGSADVAGPGGWYIDSVAINDSSCCTTNVLTPFEAWQVQYFGSTTDPNAAVSADPDGDGFTNLQEFQAGTVPTDSASAFRITGITQVDTNIVVTWVSGSGKTNALQFRDAADYTTNFADLFIVTNTTGAATNYLDGGAATNQPSRYYRIRLVP